MLQVVGQLVELAQAPGRQGAPATGAHAAGVVVQAFSIAEEQVHEQEDQQKGGDEQVEDGCLPAPTPGQPSVKTDRGISRPSMLYACYQAIVYCRQTGKATHRPEKGTRLPVPRTETPDVPKVLASDSVGAGQQHRLWAHLKRLCSAASLCIKSSLIRKFSLNMQSRMHLQQGTDPCMGCLTSLMPALCVPQIILVMQVQHTQQYIRV